MMRSPLRRYTSQQFLRFCSSVAKADNNAVKSGASESASQTDDKTTSHYKQDTPLLTAFAVTGVLGFVYTCFYFGGDSANEKKFKQEMAERMAAGKRADPHELSRKLADFLRFIDPESAPLFVNLGTLLAIQGLTEEAQQHEKFQAFAELKDDNAVMSWADFGAFVAYHALKEMGAPLVFVDPKFGRSESETARRRIFPHPARDASLDEVLDWGKQYNLSTPQTLAVLGGQNAGSLLFDGAKERDITTSIYRRVIEAQNQEELNEIPYGRALGATEYTRQCCFVFAQDHLYWNKYFMQGLTSVLEHNWFSLKMLPHRMFGTTTDPAWATRQQKIYGVGHQYSGSSLR